MMSLVWLVPLRYKKAEKGASDLELAELTVPEVRRLLEVALPLPLHSPELRLAWSKWRRARRQ